jgi:hypothetical protein
LPDSGNICQTLIFAFCNFFRASQTPKNIFEKIIFLKIISSKLFYDENHFMSKQTEH